jgi:hypothetical protein
MQLNESTYETIFLLYIDKELSPKERLEVETFIADNPSYALAMEALQTTVLSSNKIQYPFKENLKQQAETRLEALEEDWNQTYATILKADVETIPGLTTPFKNALKKTTVSEGIVLKPFAFNQQKFTYAAIAACLMIFLGYQQLIKVPESNSVVASNKVELVPSAASAFVETGIRKASPKVSLEKFETIVKTKQPVKKIQEAITRLDVSNSSKTQRIHVIQQESISMAGSNSNNRILNNQAITTKLPISYNNPITINATPLPITSTNIDAEPTVEEKDLTSYEVIDTEDPNRTIFIANFEIDGNKLRGLKRKVTSLFKNNKSERNQ